MSAEEQRRLLGRFTTGAAVAMGRRPAGLGPGVVVAGDPTKCDTDRGGISDGAEIKARSNPADVKSGPRNPRGRVETNGRLPHGG